MSPSMRTESIRSFIRFTHRSSVLLPHPDGPISAVTFPCGTPIDTSNSACFVPYHRDRSSISRTNRSFASPACTSAGGISPRPIASSRPPVVGGWRFAEEASRRPAPWRVRHRVGGRVVGRVVHGVSGSACAEA